MKKKRIKLAIVLRPRKNCSRHNLTPHCFFYNLLIYCKHAAEKALVLINGNKCVNLSIFFEKKNLSCTTAIEKTIYKTALR